MVDVAVVLAALVGLQNSHCNRQTYRDSQCKKIKVDRQPQFPLKFRHLPVDQLVVEVHVYYELHRPNHDLHVVLVLDIIIRRIQLLKLDIRRF